MIRHLQLLPFYYFMPEDIIKAHSKRFQSFPRNPHLILQSTEMIEYIESPEFAVEIGDIISAGVWYYLVSENEINNSTTGFLCCLIYISFAPVRLGFVRIPFD